MEQNPKEQHDEIAYVSCAKCKKMEDTFTKDETPEDGGWEKKGQKWYCICCVKTKKNEKNK